MTNEQIQEFINESLATGLLDWNWQESNEESNTLPESIEYALELGILITVKVIVNNDVIKPKTAGEEYNEYLILATFINGETETWHCGQLFFCSLEDYIKGAELFQQAERRKNLIAKTLSKSNAEIKANLINRLRQDVPIYSSQEITEAPEKFIGVTQ